MTWFEKVVTAHTSVTDQVSHGERMDSDRYLVWQEDGRNDLMADDRHVETAVTGTTDLFTKRELDPWVQQMEESFEEHGIWWELNSIQYEPNTGFTHYEWIWSV